MLIDSLVNFAFRASSYREHSAYHSFYKYVDSDKHLFLRYKFIPEANTPNYILYYDLLLNLFQTYICALIDDQN